MGGIVSEERSFGPEDNSEPGPLLGGHQFNFHNHGWIESRIPSAIFYFCLSKWFETFRKKALGRVWSDVGPCRWHKCQNIRAPDTSAKNYSGLRFVTPGCHSSMSVLLVTPGCHFDRRVEKRENLVLPGRPFDNLERRPIPAVLAGSWTSRNPASFFEN